MCGALRIYFSLTRGIIQKKLLESCCSYICKLKSHKIENWSNISEIAKPKNILLDTKKKSTRSEFFYDGRKFRRQCLNVIDKT